MNPDANFAPETVLAQKVITLTASERAIQLVFQDAGGTAFPFWSSRSRAEEVQKASPEYESFALREILLPNFLHWLVQLEADHIRIGLNWSAETLATHFDAGPDSDLVRHDSIQAIVLKERLQNQIDAKDA
jgi:hypothetical protein